jgi:dipeptidyl aminopeptidase/acylaminoacyl peptidase
MHGPAYILSGAVLMCCAAVLMSAGPHAFTVLDLVTMRRVSDPQVSPDGEWIVFVVRETDLGADKGIKNLWLVRRDGSGLCQLTRNDAGSHSPIWTQDGKSVHFLSGRSGSTQVWKISISSGEEEQVSFLPLDAGILKISPDGNLFLVSAEVFPGMSMEESARCMKLRKKSKSAGMVYEKTFIRLWDAWNDGRRSHLFIFREKVNPVDLMRDWDADAPTKPWGGIEEIAFTPDSRGLVFTARSAAADESWSTNTDLFYVPVDASVRPKKITLNPAADTQPAFSPNGKLLAFLTMERPGYEADRYRVMIADWRTNEPVSARCLTQSWDRSPSSIFWSEDSKTLYALADHLGQHALFSINIRSGDVETVVEKGTIRSAQPSGQTIVFTMDHLKSPTELYTIKPNGKTLRQITSLNGEVLKNIQMGEPEQFTFKGWHNETVHAYLVKPADFDPGKKYPLALLIHGGPQGCFGNDFHYRWNSQVYAGAGYAALMIDFHGSTGYGQAFTDSIRNDWGGKPLEDLKKGLDETLRRYSWIDGENIAALGASYGGYMIYWIAGKWPDRFKCLVSHDGNLDTRMAYFDTEELWFPEWEHAGTPWEYPDHFEKHNPIRLIQNWKTPMLVIHGELDFRVPVTQGIAAFNALQRKGIESRMLYFPDENHWVQRPGNSILWHETVIEWLDNHCKQQD